jgi:PAS domain S-box-containing protein
MSSMKPRKLVATHRPSYKGVVDPSLASFPEAYYQTLIELSPQIVWMTNVDGTATTYCNKHWYEYSGLTLEQIAGNGWRAALHPDDQERTIAVWYAAVAAGRPFTVEYRLRRADGAYRWHLAKGLPVRDENGAIVNWMGIAIDIHDSKVSQLELSEKSERLRLAEARLSAILATEPECVKLIAPDQTLEYMNPAGLAMIQADSLEQVKGQSVLDLLDPRYRSAYEELTRNVLLGESGRLEFEIAGLRGRRLWLETHAVPLLDAQGKASHVLAVTRDITERRAAQQALQASEARFRALIENSGDAIGLLSRETEVLYASPATSRILGYTPDELVGRRAMDLVHPEDVPAIESELREIVDRPYQAANLRARIQHKDGTWRILEGTFTNLLHDPNIRAIVSNYRDVTDRVRAAEALLQSEKRFEAAFRSSPLPKGISTLAEGRCLDVNDAFLQMVGYKREEIVGRTAQEVNIWERTADREHMVRQLAETGRVSGLQTTFRTRTGEIREIELFARLVELDSVPCILGISRDVTEAKNLELQLQQAQKMEAVGQLAGGVAHDFNNLVMIINGCAELIKDAVGDNPAVLELAEQVLDAGRKAASLTKQLLAFSRRQPQDLKVFDLRDVVTRFCKILPRFVREDIEIKVSPHAEAGLVFADPGQIEQVIMNLVLNARDAMPGGGKLTVETNNLELSADSFIHHGVKVPPGRYVMLAIRDTGTGMDAEVRKHIFEPFFTTKEVGKGTGLGLATVYGIVKQNQGFVFVDSELGRGTTLKVYFPRRDGGKKSKQSAPATKIETAAGSETILVVEDEKAVRSVVAQCLSSRGYTVLEAEHGAAGLQICRGHHGPIHVLLSDVVMPGMTGPEFVRAALGIHPEAQVIFMSGHSDRGVEAHGLKVKPAILRKPMELMELLKTVRSLLNQKQGH